MKFLAQRFSSFLFMFSQRTWLRLAAFQKYELCHFYFIFLINFCYTSNFVCYRSLIPRSIDSSKPYILGAVSELTDNLLLSSAAAVLPTILDALDVRCVINVAAELPDTPLHDDSIVYYKINVHDNSNSNLAPYFDITSDLIHNVSNSEYCIKRFNFQCTMVI